MQKRDGERRYHQAVLVRTALRWSDVEMAFQYASLMRCSPLGLYMYVYRGHRVGLTCSSANISTRHPLYPCEVFGLPLHALTLPPYTPCSFIVEVIPAFVVEKWCTMTSPSVKRTPKPAGGTDSLRRCHWTMTCVLLRDDSEALSGDPGRSRSIQVQKRSRSRASMTSTSDEMNKVSAYHRIV